MNDSTPKVSVCIPVYNGAKYLAQAIDSTLNQTFADFELIVVDDCSTDGSDEIVRSLTDDRLRFEKNSQRLGLVQNWNKCIELSRGKYVYVFHQDDVMLPQNVQEKVRTLDANRSVGLVYSDIDQIDHKGDPIAGQSINCGAGESVYDGFKFFERLIQSENLICCSSVIARKECYQRLGGYDYRLPYTADFEMWMRIALFYDIAYLPYRLTKYRWHSSNETYNYLDSVSEFEQILMAKRLVLKKCQHRVSDAKSLVSSAATRLAERAIDSAYRHYSYKRYPETKRFLMFALKCSRHSVCNTRVHRLAAKLLLGTRGTEAVVEIKRLFASIRTA